jgi:hypothetical protein
MKLGRHRNVSEKELAIREPECGSRGESNAIRAACYLPKGHVKTRADWHESISDTENHAKTNTFETMIKMHEVVRWAPSQWEIPASGRDEQDYKAAEDSLNKAIADLDNS